VSFRIGSKSNILNSSFFKKK